MKNKNWIKTKEKLPCFGVLCVVYFPVGVNKITKETTGPIAMAYFRENEGWVYADIPSKLRFEPYYWQPFAK